MIDEQMIALLANVKDCKQVANHDVTWVFDSETSHLLFLQRDRFLCKKQKTLVFLRWIVLVN